MNITIEKIHLYNYKKFEDFIIKPNKDINILVGDNEAGKSTILEAIDLVCNGSSYQVENLGLQNLFNKKAVKKFLQGKRSFKDLPELRIELYLSPNNDFTLNGKNNMEGRTCNGISLKCIPNQEYRNEVNNLLKENDNYFPYEYYQIKFKTFADESFTGNKKKVRTLLIDNGKNSRYFNTEFVKATYNYLTEDNPSERIKNKSNYRIYRDKFNSNCLINLNKIASYESNYLFGLKDNSNLDFENDLMIFEDDVCLDNKGTGKQVIIKTEYALKRANKNIDIILIEEPENHLSPINLRKLIHKISNKGENQLFISTHNSLISTRLELRNLIILPTEQEYEPLLLSNLNEETSKYFMKVPPAGIIEFTLAKKVILVEGPSEYLLIDKFYNQLYQRSLEEDNIHVLDIRGLSFKRYLEIAQITGSKIAVITDNDKNYENNIEQRYKDFENKNIRIFSEPDNKNYTFEVVLYNNNKDICNKLFPNKSEYMLNNKTDAALKLLESNEILNIPSYFKEAFEWIRS